MVIGAYQHEVGQFGGSAVFPVPDVVGVQAAGRSTTGNRAAAVSVFQGPAKPAADQARGTAGADDLAVAFEPDLAGGIAGQVASLGLAEQWSQMQRRGVLRHIDMHHHGCVLSVGSAAGLRVPPRLDQTQERLDCAR